MLTKTKIALAAALILGSASAVLANDTATDEKGGGPAQTWQDIARDAQDIQNQIKSEYHTGASDFGSVKPSKATRSLVSDCAWADPASAAVNATSGSNFIASHSLPNPSPSS